MQNVTMSVSDLLDNPEIEFCDSGDMIADKHKSGEIWDHEYDELMSTQTTKETKQRVLDWKPEECDEAFINSIDLFGIANPIALLNNVVNNGHHRIAAAQHLGIDIPVDIYDSWDEFDRLHEWDKPGLVNCWGDHEC